MNVDESGDGDLGDVAMPGFIDILSSVITVFMFFMLITSAIMFFMSIQMKKNAMDEGRKETQSALSEELQEYLRKVKTGEITLQELSTKIDQMKQDQPNSPSASSEMQNSQQGRAAFGKSTEQKVSYSDSAKDMTIVFADKGIAVSDDTTKSLSNFLDTAKAHSAGKPVVIDIEVPDNPDAVTLSISREVALGRMLNVRNVLLSRKVPAANISAHNIATEKVGDSYDWVRIHVRQ